MGQIEEAFVTEEPDNQDRAEVGQAEPAHSGRPRELRIALILFIVSTVLWVPITGADPTLTPGLGPLLLVLYITFGVRATGGRPKARITVTVASVLLVFLLAPHVWLGFGGQTGNLYGPEYAVMDLVALACCVAALVLLYLPVSNGYFRRPGRTERASRVF